jgi:hypothetical protein
MYQPPITLCLFLLILDVWITCRWSICTEICCKNPLVMTDRFFLYLCYYNHNSMNWFKMRILVFWDVTLCCCLSGSHCLGGSRCLHFRGLSTPRGVSGCVFKTCVLYLHIPTTEDNEKHHIRWLGNSWLEWGSYRILFGLGCGWIWAIR